MEKPYLLHCESNVTANLNSLEKFFADTSQIDLNSDSKLATLVGYAALILQPMSDITSKSLDDVLVTHLIGFIDTPLLEKVANNLRGANEAELDELGAQLLYVAAAMGQIEDAKPYSPEELNAVLSGGDVKFHETLVLVTLSYIILNGDQAYLPFIMKFLAQDNYDLATEYEWIEAFMISLFIHAAWQFFPALSVKDRQYILQRYFYRAVASGVPVKDWLGFSYEIVTGAEVNTIFQPLLASLELVPADIDLLTTKKFSDIMKEFITVISREQISTLAQEQYLNKWYPNTASGQLFRSWLRESLNTVYRIQTNTLK